jgi:phenylpropionate dioxygenase-like ring-hydroxylating dioxygenase large terminal subunit
VSVADRYPLPREAWYIATASSQLGDAPFPAQVFEDRTVLLRGPDGGPFALQDRCPHRGVALSLGRAEAGQVACAYHGWRFGADGACGHIPSLDPQRRLPAGIGVRSYPCAEQDGYVWVWMGDGPPEPAAPRRIDGFGERIWLQGQLDLACEAMLPIENNLDICHPYFTHPGLHPQYFAIQAQGFRSLRYDLAPDEAGLTIGLAGAGSPMLRFDLPDRVTVGGVGPFVVVVHHVPLAPGHCRQHWLLSQASASADAPHTVTWVDEEPEIFAQDRRVMESAQRAYETEGDAFERSVEADAPTLAARRIVRWAAQGRWPAEKARMPARRTIAARS